MLKADFSIFDEIHECPHCHQRLTYCNAPPFHVGDGLGWGTDLLLICLNDECSLFVNGWKFIEERFGHVASYRYVLVPGEKSGTQMLVQSQDAFKGSETDIELYKMGNRSYAEEKEALSKLESCVEAKNLQPVLCLILNDSAAIQGRERACELLCAINDLSCIDPIRNHVFQNKALEHKVSMAIKELLDRNFKKECPYCAEIIKVQAKVCKHCQRDLE